MQMMAFLPGLILALVIWILPLAFRLLPSRMLAWLADCFPRLPTFAPWIRSIALPYLGLLFGWISTRDYGLGGHTLPEWAIGGVAAVLLGILLGRISVRLSIALGWGVVCDEARWTLYRAAAWPWVTHLPFAVAAALVAACAEFILERMQRKEKAFDEVGILFLVHAAGSAVLFLLAHNIFLSMIFYLTAVIFSTPDIRSRINENLNQFRK